MHLNHRPNFICHLSPDIFLSFYGVFSSKLQLLEWVSSEAVTSILHKLIEQRMEQHCRGEYERSFLLEFQEVKKSLVGVDGASGPFEM